MENEKVSVIIPVYNSESTISRAVNSALTQTYKNIEVIIIDDGSSDKTAELADSFAARDSRVRVIHKKNEGVSAARNDGIKACTGERFITLDGDDYIDEVMVERLLRDVQLYETDVSICGFRRIFDNGKKEIRRAETDFQGTCEEFLNTVFLNLFDEQLIHTHSNKLYKTSIVREHDIYYKKGMSINEDIYFSLRYLRYCESISVVREAYMNYVQHDVGESLITKYNENGLETCFDVLRACDELLDSCNVDDEIVNAMNNRMFFHICGFAGMPYYKTDYSDEKKLEIIKELCGREEFRRLIAQTDPKGLKNIVAWLLFKSKNAGLYHRICKLLYSGKLYTSRKPEAQEEPEPEDTKADEEIEPIQSRETEIEETRTEEPEADEQNSAEITEETKSEETMTEGLTEEAEKDEIKSETEEPVQDESDEKLPPEIEKVINDALNDIPKPEIPHTSRPHYRKRHPVIREVTLVPDKENGELLIRKKTLRGAEEKKRHGLKVKHRKKGDRIAKS